MGGKISMGIDFGLTRCGVAAVRETADGFELVATLLIQTDKDKPWPERLLDLWGELAEFTRKHKPEVVALESLAGGFVQRGLTLAQGGMMALWAFEKSRHKADEWPPIGVLAPAAIKKRVSGNGRASKSQVRDAVAQHVSVEGLSVDEVDAVAAALVVLAV